MSRTTRRRRPRKYGNTPDANLVRRAMTRLNLTQGALGAALDVTQGAIGHIVQERRPLTKWLREGLLMLLAGGKAMELIAEFENREVGTNVFDCVMQNATHSEFVAHLPTCATCLARSTVMRRIAVRP
jgi:hypothetical protein